MRRIVVIFQFLVVFNSVSGQSSNSEFDSLVIGARQALLYEDAYRAGYFIQNIKPLSKAQPQVVILNSLILEKLVLENDYDSAGKYIEIARKSKNEALRIHAQIMEGKILNRQLQFKKSIAVLEGVEGKLKPNVLKVEFFHWIGNSIMETGDYKKASEYLYQAIEICKRDSLHYFVKLALVRITNGLNNKKAGNFDSAEREFRLAIRILENTPFPKYKELGRAYTNLGNVYNEQWNYLPAREYYLKSLELNQTHLRDSNQLTILCNNIALFYQRYGNLLKSKEYYDKWFSLFNDRKQDFQDTGTPMLINYGAFLNDILEYDYERKILQEASDFLNKDATPESQLRLLLAKSHNFETMYLFDSTKVQLNKARELLLKHPEVSKHLWYTFYLQESVLSTNTTRFSEADSLIALAIGIAKELGADNTNDLAKAYRIQGINFDLQLYHREATASFKKSLKIMDEILPSYHFNRIVLLNNIGITFLENNEFDSARHYLMLALQSNRLPLKNDAIQFSDPFEVLVTNFHLLKIAMREDLSQLREAEIHVVSSYSIIENRRQSLRSFEDQRIFNKAVRDFFDLAVEYYHRLFTATHEPGYFNKAFEMAEKARYQSLQNALRNVRIGEFAGVAQKIVAEEQTVQKEIGLLTRQMVEEIGLGTDANPDLLQEYNNTLTALQSRHDQVLDSVKNNLPGFYNLKFSATTVSPSTLKKDLVKDDMAIIQYHVGYEKVHVLIITKENNYMLLLKDKATLMRSIRGLSNSNRLKLTSEFIPAAHQLYNQLMFPIDSVLKSNRKITRYILIPDGEINYVPFDALVIKPAVELNKCEFLLSDKTLSYGYSSTLLWQEFSDYAQELKKIRMLAYAPNFNAEPESNLSPDMLRSTATKTKYATYDFPPLQMNASEVKSISSILTKKGFQNESVFDLDADESSFKSKDLNQYEIIHLATHGFVDYPITNSSGIAFSFNQASREDGILFMDEIFSLRCHTHLVCLSACQTGFGQVDVGEGIMSMTRAFLYAGVKNLVVSLWAVQDNSTALLMQKFYQEFVKSKSISHSLRKAKLQMLQEAEFSHPYNWAGFIHVGMN